MLLQKSIIHYDYGYLPNSTATWQSPANYSRFGLGSRARKRPQAARLWRVAATGRSADQLAREQHCPAAHSAGWHIANAL